MKKLLKYTLYLISLYFGEGWGEVFAQNLVPNPSFELYSTCPYAYYQIYFATPWIQPNTIHLGTMYFNQCTTYSNISVPSNINGYQQSHSGNAYSGIGWLYYIGNNDSYGREYLEVQLDSVLIKDKKYFVSFYVSLSDGSRYATDAVGVYFSPDSVTYYDSLFHYLPLIPQVKNPLGNIISDTATWVLISGEYIATGGEKFITIGNFYPDSASAVDTINPAGYPAAYYYIDDVSVVADTTTGVSELQKDNMKFKVYPNPTADEISIEYSLNNEQAILELYNLIGERVGVFQLNKDNQAMKISLSNYEAGIYFYKAFSEGRIIAADKLVIIKK